jgi:hypothetical protein
MFFMNGLTLKRSLALSTVADKLYEFPQFSVTFKGRFQPLKESPGIFAAFRSRNEILKDQVYPPNR